MDDFDAAPDDFLSGPRLPLITAAEAREAVGYLQLLEQLDLSPRGEAAGQLAADLARRLPTVDED